MALRPQHFLPLAVPLAVLLSSCLLLTDTEVADPLPEETIWDVIDSDGEPSDRDGEPSDRAAIDLDRADAGPADGERRCVNRVVEIYDGELEGWEELDVCTREQRCLDGACVGRPDGFSESCEGPGDCAGEELDCIGELCLTHEPSEADGPCIGGEECEPALLCSRRGICQEGASGDPCVDEDDCDPMRAAFCRDNVCRPANVGDSCTGDESCGSDVLYCDPDGYCRAGVEGDPCSSDAQCEKTGRYCGPDEQCHDGSTGDLCDNTADCAESDDICRGDPDSTCQDRIVGDACDADGLCPSGLYCASFLGECHDGSTDDYCDDTADCDEVDDICKGTPSQCRVRVEGDVCGIDDECPGGLYCANRQCQNGSTGDFCDFTPDCIETNDICKGAPATCQDRVKWDPCAGDTGCPGGLYCANELCQDGSTEDYCNATAECDEVDDICKGSLARCLERVEGDSCGGPEECPATVPICSTVGICQDGSDGDACTVDTAATDCLGANCSNDHCAPTGFAYIPAGTFCMGSPDGGTECMGGTDSSEPDRESDEGPIHEVTLTRGFILQETEVTQGQWLERFPDNNPSDFDECGLDCPVEMVNWWEAVAYANALSVSEELEPCYTLEGLEGCDPSLAGTGITCTGVSVSDPATSENPYLCEGYRLPMEAEWEYAARAGTTTAWYCGSAETCPDEIAWYGSNSDSRTHVVGEKNRNEWHLYDMSGNTWEWVWDRYGGYSSGPTMDPMGHPSEPSRVFRGGDWANDARFVRSANRNSDAPGVRYGNIGFRIARSVP